LKKKEKAKKKNTTISINAQRVLVIKSQHQSLWLAELPNQSWISFGIVLDFNGSTWKGYTLYKDMGCLDWRGTNEEEVEVYNNFLWL